MLRVAATRTAPCLLVRAGVLLLVVAGLGCAVGPRYSKPATTSPPEYKETPANWKTAEVICKLS